MEITINQYYRWLKLYMTTLILNVIRNGTIMSLQYVVNKSSYYCTDNIYKPTACVLVMLGPTMLIPKTIIKVNGYCLFIIRIFNSELLLLGNNRFYSLITFYFAS